MFTYNRKRAESAENISKAKSLCTAPVTPDEAAALKSWYMNHYGMFMSGRIITVILAEFLFVFFILQTGADALWDGIPYAETVIYGTAWWAGGAYIVHMFLSVCRRTYDLKLALDAGRVKKTACAVSFREVKAFRDSRKNEIHMYVTDHKKNDPVWFFLHRSKHRGTHILSNASSYDQAGTRLTLWHVDDRLSDLFITADGRQLSPLIDRKSLQDALQQELSMIRARSALKRKRRNEKKKGA